MTTIKELLGQGDVKKPRRNFLQENVRRLKEMKLEKTNKLNSQRNKNPQVLSERRNAQTMAGSSRNLQSRSPPPRNNRPVVTRVKPQVEEVLEPSPSPDHSPKGYRSQGCQTLDQRQLETLYCEGVIRYPSARPGEGEREADVREAGQQTDTRLEVLLPPPPPVDPPETGLHWDDEKDRAGTKDFVRMNATIPESHRLRTAELSQSGRSDPTRAPPTYQKGIVPKYLREHKRELEKVSRAKAEAGDCPDGHVLLPDDIRHKHLTTLRQNYGDLVSQLNQLPVSTDTLRTRTRKKQIETELDKIEAAIALFSREKVFVKADS